MLEGFILGSMALTILVVGLLYHWGRRYITRGEAWNFQDQGGPWPLAAVIIPVAGVYPELKQNLRSRLTQNYPNYQVIFATRSQADPATDVIRSLLKEFPQHQLVISGPASGCSQKNHNLLEGLKAVAPGVDLFVFCDANQTTPAHWLQALVQPLVHGESVVSSSYHHIFPQDKCLATLGRSLTVLMIYLGKGVSSWDQPWGGSTAITREAFTSLGVQNLWSHTVVDDVTLAMRLQQAGSKMAAASGAVLATPARETLASWEDWFIRQLIYLKFYFYFPWMMAGVGIFFLLGLVLLAIGQLGLATMGSASWQAAGLSSIFLFSLGAFLTLLRRLHPHPGSWPSYLTAGSLTLVMAAWCHAKTWFTREFRWRNLVYTVNRQGRVTRIQEL